MTTEPHKRSATPFRRDVGLWPPGSPAGNQSLVAVGTRVMVGLVLIGLSFVVAALLVHTVSASLFGGGAIIGSGSAPSTAGLQGLELQRLAVDERRGAVAAYAASVAEFQTMMSRRPPDALGLDRAEARRREGVLTGIVLECIHAVDRYNLGAQAFSVTQLQAAGLPARYVWSTDCAAGQ
ncbi:MAG TPA: hypothetical protein VEZ14_01655 [Dehalococcoidia bacterium]|nr:hypothetical protein [Dehalococcoidia bacterium]